MLAPWNFHFLCPPEYFGACTSGHLLMSNALLELLPIRSGKVNSSAGKIWRKNNDDLDIGPGCNLQWNGLRGSNIVRSSRRRPKACTRDRFGVIGIYSRGYFLGNSGPDCLPVDSRKVTRIGMIWI